MKKLLIIDPQNDFCDIPGAALPVAGLDAEQHAFLKRAEVMTSAQASGAFN